MWLPARLLALGAPLLRRLLESYGCNEEVRMPALRDKSPPGELLWTGQLPRPSHFPFS